MEIGLDEFIFARDKISDTLDEVLAERVNTHYEDDLKVVWVVDEGMWWLVQGYEKLIAGILKGEEYFDVVPVGEVSGGMEPTDSEKEYYEDYDGWEEWHSRSRGEDASVPVGEERWVADATQKFKGLEKLSVIEDD